MLLLIRSHTWMGADEKGYVPQRFELTPFLQSRRKWEKFDLLIESYRNLAITSLFLNISSVLFGDHQFFSKYWEICEEEQGPWTPLAINLWKYSWLLVTFFIDFFLELRFFSDFLTVYLWTIFCISVILVVFKA